MKHVKFGRAVVAGLVANVLSFIVGGGGYHLFGGVFQLEPQGVWKWTPEMNAEMSVGWWIFLIGGNTVAAIVFALVYALLFHGIPGKGLFKGMVFGVIVWLIGVVPAIFTMYILVNIHPTALLYFLTQSLVEYLVYGPAVALVYGPAFAKATAGKPVERAPDDQSRS
ncbi:MAG: DUF6789 family protein [Planctomycetota bacterium]|jgi:hypothetical protein